MSFLSQLDQTSDPQARMGLFFGALRGDWRTLFAELRESRRGRAQVEFNGIAQAKDRFYLTRARSELIFDAQNIELTGGCDLPNRPAPQAR